MDVTTTLEPAEPTPPAAEPEEEENLPVHRLLLRNRFVLKDLDPGSRYMVYGAIAALFVTAAAIATRDLPWPGYDVTFANNRPTAIPITHFVLTLVLLGMLWTYLLYGAWRAYTPIRIAGLLLYLGVMAWLAYQIPDWRAAFPAVLVVPALIRRRQPKAHGWWRLALFFIATMLCYGAVAYFAGDQLLFTLTLDEHLYWLSQASIPMLFLVGVELSEVAGHGGREIFHRTARFARLLPVVAITAAALALGTELWGWDLITNVISVGWGLLVVAVLVLAYRFLAPRDLDAHLKPFTSVIAVATLSAGFAISIAIQYFAPYTGTDLLDYNLKSPDLTVSYPFGWNADSKAYSGSAAAGAVVFSVPGTDEHAAVVTVTSSSDPQSDLTTWLGLNQGDTANLTNQGAKSGWTSFDLTGTILGSQAAAGEAFVQQADGYDFFVYCWAPDASSWQDLKPGCEGLATSLQTASGSINATTGNSTAATANAQNDQTVAQEAKATTLFWVLVLIASAVALFTYRRRGRSSQLAWWLLVASIVSVFSNGATGQSGVIDLPGGIQIGTLDTGSLAEAAGLLSLVWIAYRYARRRPLTGDELGWLLRVNVALWLIGMLARLYYAGLDLGELGILQAVVIVLALGWEIFQSGGMITNRSSELWPRASRVSMFMGYVLLVAVAVLYFSSQHYVDTGEHVAPAFESELWPAYGLAFLGAPLIIATAFATLPWRRPAKRAPEAPAVPAPA